MSEFKELLDAYVRQADDLRVAQDKARTTAAELERSYETGQRWARAFQKLAEGYEHRVPMTDELVVQVPQTASEVRWSGAQVQSARDLARLRQAFWTEWMDAHVPVNPR